MMSHRSWPLTHTPWFTTRGREARQGEDHGGHGEDFMRFARSAMLAVLPIQGICADAMMRAIILVHDLPKMCTG
jgi:hypothetical protein